MTETKRGNWTWENTGGGVMAWTLDAWIISGTKGNTRRDDDRCVLTLSFWDDNLFCECDSQSAAIDLVEKGIVVYTVEGEDPAECTVREWAEANADCDDALYALFELFESNTGTVVSCGGGAAPLVRLTLRIGGAKAGAE